MKPLVIAIALLVLCAAVFLLRPLFTNPPVAEPVATTDEIVPARTVDLPTYAEEDFSPREVEQVLIETPITPAELSTEPANDEAITRNIRQFFETQDSGEKIAAIIELVETDPKDERVRFFFLEGVTHGDRDIAFAMIEAIRYFDDSSYAAGLKERLPNITNHENQDNAREVLAILSR